MRTSTLALTAALAVGAFAQESTSSESSAMITGSTTSSGDASAQTTITALVGTMTSGFEGSIIGANACESKLGCILQTL